MRLLSSFLLSSAVTVILFLLMGNLVSAKSSSVELPPPVEWDEPVEFDPLALKNRPKPNKIEKPEQPEKVSQPKLAKKPSNMRSPEPVTLFDGESSTNWSNDFQPPALVDGEGGAFQSFGPSLMVEPNYPVDAAKRGLEGEVTLEFDVNSRGEVENIRVIAAKPKRIFSGAATRALARWKFTPDQVDGKPIARKGERITLTFRLEDA